MQTAVPAVWPLSAPRPEPRPVAGIEDGCWLPFDLQGADVRRRPYPCIYAINLTPTTREMRITNADTGAVVYDDEKGGWQ
jgi:hypothetical protein